MKNNLAITALGRRSGDLVAELSGVVADCDCSVEESRMTVLGDEFALLMLVRGNWSALARLDTALKRAEKQHNLQLTIQRTGDRQTQEDMLPYMVEVITLNRPGIIQNLSQFFRARKIGIEELASHSYSAAQTGAHMFSVSMTIGIPADTPLAPLRDEFFDFCDQLNLDAVLEPIKV